MKTKLHLKQSNFYLSYTILFIIVCLLVTPWFYLNQRTFIWHSDGWWQHYKALVYYSDYLKTILKNIFIDHSFTIPTWSFSLGEGNDILTTLHYYCIGDPFSIGCVFFNKSNMYIYYGFSILLRMYCSGLTFHLLVKGVRNEQDNIYAHLAGSLMYAFCCWNLYNLARHPYFINPLVYLPLLILGIERIIKDDKPFLFIFAVMITTLSNFYFFYILALLTIVYLIIRLFYLHKNYILQIIQSFAKISLYTIEGCAIAAIIFLPLAYTFISNPRASVSYPLDLLYNRNYYLALPGKLVSSSDSDWLILGVASQSILSLFLFLKSKGNGFLKTLLVTSLIFMVFPVFGKIMNGMSYVTNRWCWAFVLLNCYIFVTHWDALISMTKKDYIPLGVFVIGYFALCYFLPQSNSNESLSMITISLITVFVLFTITCFSNQAHAQHLKKIFLLFSIIVSLFFNSFWMFSSHGKDVAKAMVTTTDSSMNIDSSETKALFPYKAEISSEYRYSAYDATLNSSLISGLHSIDYFWSIANPFTSHFKDEIAINEPMQQKTFGYDSRTDLLALSGVKYYLSDNAFVPYGYEYIKEDDGNVVYKNNYSLPIIYSYNENISEENWDRLNAVEKQNALLKYAYTSEKIPQLNTRSLNLSTTELLYTIDPLAEDISIENNQFVVTKADSSILLNVDGIKNAENYIYFENLSYSLIDQDNSSSSKTSHRNLPTSVKIHFETNSVKNSINYYTESNSFYGGRNNFAVNLGYHKQPLSTVKITFSKSGVYSFDSLKVISETFEDYESIINQRKQFTLLDFQIKDNVIDTSVDIFSDNTLLCFAIPYSKGWKIYVDGEQKDLIVTNIKNMSVLLSKGQHSIRLVYRTPLLFEGTLISLIAIVFLFFHYKKTKRS